MQEGRAQAEKERGAEVGHVEAGGVVDGNGVMERKGRAGSARRRRGGPAEGGPERAGSAGSRRGLGQSHPNILTQVVGPSVPAELPPAAGLGRPRDPRLTAHGAEGMFLAGGRSALLGSSDF